MFVKINILHTLRESQYVYVHGEFSNFVRKHDGYRIHSFDVAKKTSESEIVPQNKKELNYS